LRDQKRLFVCFLNLILIQLDTKLRDCAIEVLKEKWLIVQRTLFIHLCYHPIVEGNFEFADKGGEALHAESLHVLRPRFEIARLACKSKTVPDENLKQVL